MLAVRAEHVPDLPLTVDHPEHAWLSSCAALVMRVRVCARVQYVCVHVCVSSCVYVCVRALVCVRVRSCVCELMCVCV